MKNIIFLILVSYGGYQWYLTNNESAGYHGVLHNEVIMYSLTTCGYCKIKVKELESANIEFTEYFIDKDINKRNELTSKLIAAGFNKGKYGTPSFDVHGIMLPNNPELSLIKSKLEKQ